MTAKILSDSSCDILELDGVDFVSVPLVVSTDECTFVDDADLDVHAMNEYLANWKGRSYSACPGVGQWVTAFGDADEVYVCTITSGLSGSYNSAMVAKETYEAEHPGRQVHVFDSLSTGPEPHLHLLKLRDLILEGKRFQEVVAEMTDYMKHTRLFYSLSSLHNLAQNGRVPKLVAGAVNLLGIRIIGTPSLKGELQNSDKVRGDKRAVAKLVELMEEASYAGGRVVVGHTENPKFAKKLADTIREKWNTAEPIITPCRGLDSFYAEPGALLVGCECTAEYV